MHDKRFRLPDGRTIGLGKELVEVPLHLIKQLLEAFHARLGVH